MFYHYIGLQIKINNLMNIYDENIKSRNINASLAFCILI